jgi:hypothetical protein
MTICENCGWEIRENRRHQDIGNNKCLVTESDTERPVGWSSRRYRDIYKKK